MDRKVIRRWCRQIDYGRILPLLAFHRNRAVVCASLHQQLGGWKRHIGHIRLAMHASFRTKEVAIVMLSQLVEIAREIGLEKLEAELMGDHRLTRRAFAELGFSEMLTVPDYTKDMQAITHDYVLMGRQLVTDEEFAGAGD